MSNVQVRRIRDFGKVGFVLSIIITSLALLGWLVILAMNIALAQLPKNFVNVDLSGTATMKVDLSEVPGFIKAYDLDEMLQEAKKEIESGHLTLNFFDSNKLVVDHVEIEDTQVSLNADGTFMNLSNRNLSTLVTAALIKLSLMLVVFGFIICLFEGLRNCESPFEDKIVKRLQMFAFSLLPWALIQPAADNMINNWLFSKGDINLSLDFSKLLIVAVVFILCTIFKYGAKLQQESDETL